MNRINKFIPYYTAVVGLILTVFLISSYNAKDDKTDSTSIKMRSVDLKGDYDLAGEKLPMNNFDAVERLDRELVGNTYLHGSTILNLKLSTRYFPYFEKKLAENNIPDDMKYLAVIESNLRNTTSPAGAKGLWQFMEATGRAYNLEINKDVDERYHLEKATQAFCDHIRDLKNKFGSWTLAAAAYNAGAGRISSEIGNQRATSFYDLHLTEETLRYPFRIMALKEIMKNPTKYGYEVDQSVSYPPLDNYSEVAVNGKVDNWGDFAQKYGISYRMLKVYNTWIINTSLANASGKTYTVKIPK